MRCPANYQGDRCRKEKGHDSPLLLKPDSQHEGNFTRWDVKGAQEKFPNSGITRDLKKVDAYLESVSGKEKGPLRQLTKENLAKIMRELR